MTFSTYLRTAGPSLTPDEIKIALHRQQANQQIRAVLDLLAGEILKCHEAAHCHPAALKSPEERHFHAGTAAALEDFFDELGRQIEA
jgi:hypothetical protein